MDFLITTVVDNIKSESTSINFEFDDKTGKINRISNTGETTEKEIVVKLKNPNWTRVYIITPDKKGEDCLNIDFPITIPDFFLIKDKEQWKLNTETVITVEDNSKIISK